MPKSHRLCGVFVGCCHAGVWQAGLVVFELTNTPPSDEKRIGQPPAPANAMSPTSSCAPASRVNGPLHDEEFGHRAAPPAAAGVGVAHVARQRVTSPNQRSNAAPPRGFVATNGTRPCSIGLAN